MVQGVSLFFSHPIEACFCVRRRVCICIWVRVRMCRMCVCMCGGPVICVCRCALHARQIAKKKKKMLKKTFTSWNLILLN